MQEGILAPPRWKGSLRQDSLASAAVSTSPDGEVQSKTIFKPKEEYCSSRQQKHNADTKYKMFHLRSFMILPWQPVTGKEGSVALPERL